MGGGGISQAPVFRINGNFFFSLDQADDARQEELPSICNENKKNKYKKKKSDRRNAEGSRDSRSYDNARVREEKKEGGGKRFKEGRAIIMRGVGWTRRGWRDGEETEESESKKKTKRGRLRRENEWTQWSGAEQDSDGWMEESTATLNRGSVHPT